MSEATNPATLDDVRHVAALAHIDLAEDEQQRMLKDLNAVLGHIAHLNEVNTDGIEPMAAGLPEMEASSDDSRESLRADAVLSSLDRAPVMAEAPETDGVFFKVPKVIER